LAVSLLALALALALALTLALAEPVRVIHPSSRPK
jgi:hypothetical protein